MLGEGGVGKSCLSIQMCHNYFTKEYDPTIENSYKSQVTVDGSACMINILDTAGQEEYIAMIDQHIQAGVGFLLVYSITSRQSFEGIARFHERIIRVKDIETEDEDNEVMHNNNSSSHGEVDNDYPIVLCGNKCDLEKDRSVTTTEAKHYAKTLKVPFFETSAKTRFNVEEAFHQLVREVDRWELKNKQKQKRTDSSASSTSTKDRRRKIKCTII